MIPGLMHGLMGGGGPVSVELVDVGASSDSATVSYASSPQARDIAVLVDIARNFDGDGTPAIPTSVVPSGFTARLNATMQSAANSARLIISTRVCDGGEGASVTGMSTFSCYKRLALFRPTRAAAIGSPILQDTNIAPSAPSTMSVSVAQPAVAPQIIVAAFVWNFNETRTITGSPTLTQFASSVVRFNSAHLVMNEDDDLAAVSAALNSSVFGPLLSGLVAIPIE